MLFLYLSLFFPCRNMQCFWWFSGRYFYSILGAFRCHYQHLFSLVFWCFFDVVFFCFFVEFCRKWVPILLPGTTHFRQVFRVFFGIRFLHWFWMDCWSILEPFWSDSGSGKRCFQDVFSAEFGSTCWHLFPLHLLLFLNYSNILLISEMLLTIYKYVRTLNVVFVHRSALSRLSSL